MSDEGRSPDWIEEIRKVMDVYASVEPMQGGFLVPEELRSEILRVSLEGKAVFFCCWRWWWPWHKRCRRIGGPIVKPRATIIKEAAKPPELPT